MLIERPALKAVLDQWTNKDSRYVSAAVRDVRKERFVEHNHQQSIAIGLEWWAAEQRLEDVALEPRIRIGQRACVGIVIVVGHDEAKIRQRSGSDIGLQLAERDKIVRLRRTAHVRKI